MADDGLNWWRGALEGRFAAAHKMDPQSGFYRWMDDQTGEFLPVAIWRDDDGALVALIGDDRDGNPFALWPACWPNPITYEVYEAVLNGGDWPATGQNADAFTVLADTIAETIREAEALAGKDLVTDREARDRASDLAAKLVELRDEAEQTRVAEGAPQATALRLINEKWNPVIEGAKSRAVALKAAVGAALREVKARAAAMGIEAKTTAGTGARRAVGLRTKRETRCTDFDLLLQHYVADDRFRRNEHVCKALLGIAREDLDAGKEVPGAAIQITEYAA